MRRLAIICLFAPTLLVAGLSSPASLAAQDADCESVSPALAAQIESGMKYFDVWFQAPRAVQTFEFGGEMWIISADLGGPDFDGNGDMAHWLVTDLDADAAEIYKIGKGHADYVSDFPDAGDAGYDVDFLSEGLGAAQDCAMDAAKLTGALGVDRDTCEDRYATTRDTSGGFKTSDGQLAFRTEDDRITQVTWTFDDSFSADEARAISRDLIPDDALLAGVSAEAPRASDDQPDNYASEWLSKRFDNSVWDGADPGTFSVLYDFGDSGNGDSITVTLG